MQQAEKIAEWKINLPTEQIEGAQQSAAQVQTANYVLAVYLDNRAVIERNAIIAAATSALQEGIKHRSQSAETRAQQEFQSAISERDSAITAAQTELEAKSSSIQSDTDGKIGVPPFELKAWDIAEAVVVSAVLGIVVLILAAFLQNTIAKDGIANIVVGWLGMVFGSFGWITIPALSVIAWLIRKGILKAAERSRLSAAKASYQKAVESAEKRLLKVRPVLEENIRRSEIPGRRRRTPYRHSMPDVSTDHPAKLG